MQPAITPGQCSDNRQVQLQMQFRMQKGFTLDNPPKISNGTFTALSDSVPTEFWSP